MLLPQVVQGPEDAVGCRQDLLLFAREMLFEHLVSVLNNVYIVRSPFWMAGLPHRF